MADASSRIDDAAFQVGATYRVTGFVGQRATRSGALDGYRIWVRDPADVDRRRPPRPRLPARHPAPASPAPGATAIATISIARALKITDRPVAIDAIVTAPATLLDASGRRIVVQDASAAVELLLPTGSAAPPVGHADPCRGSDRRRLRSPAPSGRPVHRRRAAGPFRRRSSSTRRPAAAHEWRLVSVTGRVLSVHKLGDRWRAEIAVGEDRVVVVGQPGAGIPSTTLVEGRSATVVGIARRPAPTASDHRFAVTPRFPADVHVSTGSRRIAGRRSAATGAAAAGERQRRDRRQAARPHAVRRQRPSTPTSTDLAPFAGKLVRVGGLVVDLRTDGFTLDDGTAIGRIVLRGAALELLPLIEPDDALNAIGRVETSDGRVRRRRSTTRAASS